MCVCVCVCRGVVERERERERDKLHKPHTFKQPSPITGLVFQSGLKMTVIEQVKRGKENRKEVKKQVKKKTKTAPQDSGSHADLMGMKRESKKQDNQ